LEGDQEIDEFISKWIFSDIVTRLDNLTVSKTTNRANRLMNLTDSENDLVAQIYIDLFRTKYPLNEEQGGNIDE